MWPNCFQTACKELKQSHLLWVPAWCHMLAWPPAQSFLGTLPNKWLSQRSSTQKDPLPLGSPAQDTQPAGCPEADGTCYVHKGPSVIRLQTCTKPSRCAVWTDMCAQWHSRTWKSGGPNAKTGQLQLHSSGLSGLLGRPKWTAGSLQTQQATVWSHWLLMSHL